MKHLKLIFLSFPIITFFSGKAQSNLTDVCDNPIFKISTNPNEPINEEWNSWYPDDPGSYVNTGFSWYPGGDNQISFDNQLGWNHPYLATGNNTLVADWYFHENNTSLGHLWSDESSNGNGQNLNYEERDFYWEDGWELMYLNIGKLPNGAPINDKPEGSWTSFIENPVPSTVPYIVLYNRYTGLMRVFFMFWADDSEVFNQVMVRLEFPEEIIQNERVSGILRHANGLDVPLNQESKILNLISSRGIVNPNDKDEWYVAEFQLGYDLCQCMYASQFKLFFDYVSKQDVNMNMRLIQLEENLADLDKEYWNFFQSMYDEEGILTEAGNIIYPNMKELQKSYSKALEKYQNELRIYNNPLNQVKNFSVNYLLNGAIDGIVSNVLPEEELASILLNSQLDIYNNNNPQNLDEAKEWVGKIHAFGKKTLSNEFDFFSAFFGLSTDKPVKPNMPTATFTEGKIVGSIETKSTFSSSYLYVPGSLKGSDPKAVTSHNYPIYNVPVGLFANLDLPKLKVFDKGYSCTYFEEEKEYFNFGSYDEFGNYTPTLKFTKGLYRNDFEVSFKMTEPFHYALNPYLDFDLDKSSFLGAYIINLKMPYNEDVEAFVKQRHLINSNFEINNSTKLGEDSVIIEFVSNYYPLENIHNVSFHFDYAADGERLFINPVPENSGIHGENFWSCAEFPSLTGGLDYLKPELQSVKFKVLADMYFDQIGSNGGQVNTLQVFTMDIVKGSNFDDYLDMNGERSLTDDWRNYLEGEIELKGLIGLDHEAIKMVNGNKIYINAESVKISDDINVLAGYELIITALEIDVKPNSVIGSNINLESIEYFFNSEPSLPITETNDFVKNYCNNNYVANVALEKRELSSNINKEHKIDGQNLLVNLYPNPVSYFTTLSIRNMPFLTKDVRIEISDLSGRIVLMQHENVEEDAVKFGINTDMLNNGLYIVTIVIDGKVSESKKMIVQH